MPSSRNKKSSVLKVAHVMTDSPFNRPVVLDTPGILYVEAMKRLRTGSVALAKFRVDLAVHKKRESKFKRTNEDDDMTTIIRSVGALETRLASVVREFAATDVFLVAAAEAYINHVSHHVLPSAESAHFEKLSPVGKWLYLPRLMGLRWTPSLSNGPVQEFAKVVTRRNRTVHPREIKVRDLLEVDRFIQLLNLDPKAMTRGAASVEAMIRKISLSWRGGYGPDWLDPVSAKQRPPCLYIGTAEAAARFGRLRKGK